MRQPNRSLPGFSRPVEILWPNNYSRSALDVTSTLPLSITLTHLRPMVFNLPHLRQTMTEDGGLECLVEILSTVRREDDPTEVHVRKLALQCLTQFGIRGPESIRLRAIEAQVVPALITILESFWRAIESDIREHIDFILKHPLPTPPTSRPLQPYGQRRRAATLGSIASSSEPLEGLQIRTRVARLFVRSPLGPANHGNTPAEPVAGTQTITSSENNTPPPPEQDRDRMEVDTVAANEAEEDNSLEEAMNDVEALRSPPPEEDVSYSASFPPEENPPPSSQNAPSPARVTTAMEIDGPRDVSTISQPDVTPPNPPSPTPPAIETIPLTRDRRLPIPPNAPIIPFTTPFDVSQYHRAPAPAPPRRTSPLHSEIRDPLDDLRIPRSEDVLECLETLAYLSKYPKLRAVFNSTHFVPSLLREWATPEDEHKDVNVFEIVERFTFAEYHPPRVRHFASIIMRHYSRKDEVVPKRQCSYMQCRKWEPDDPTLKFMHCPRCKYLTPARNGKANNRRTKYCSKGCFNNAWPGHSEWCSEIERRQRDRESRTQQSNAEVQSQTESGTAADGVAVVDPRVGEVNEPMTLT
jgi:hypothetical protein